jgi:hypothetical protein
MTMAKASRFFAERLVKTIHGAIRDQPGPHGLVSVPRPDADDLLARAAL